MAQAIHGRMAWSLSVDKEGQREYSLTTKVQGDIGDGPQVIMNAAGLPAIGSSWSQGNDLDVWAFCLPYMKVSEFQKLGGDPTEFWKVEQKFSTIPIRRCQDDTITDPLLEPQKISGSFVKYTKEATLNRDGTSILSSAKTPLRGPEVEFDANRPTVRIETNVLTLGLARFSQMIDTLNVAPLWGLPAKTIKLSNVSWERKVYGSCTFYYTRSYEFDIDYNTFDRQATDQSNKALNGEWQEGVDDWVLVDIAGSPPDPDKPSHFTQFLDRANNPTNTLLDGTGKPVTNDTPVPIDVYPYPLSNFSLLGIPATL